MSALRPTPIVAREMIKTHNPDVLALDINCFKMDGLDFLLCARLMQLRPMPVVMISSPDAAGFRSHAACARIGRGGFLPKPRLDSTAGMENYGEFESGGRVWRPGRVCR